MEDGVHLLRLILIKLAREIRIDEKRADADVRHSAI